MAELKPSQLIEELKGAWNAKNKEEPWDDARVPAMVTVVGWLDVPEAGPWRIYLTHSLTDYYELSGSDVVHSVPLGGDEGERVWVRQGAAVRHVRMRATRAEVAPPRLFGGSIAAGYGQPPGAVPSVALPTQSAPGGGWTWPDDEDDPGGWQGSGCKKGCFSYSP